MLTISIAFAIANTPLVASTPIEIPGGPGKFDFTQIDAKNRLFLACHPGRKSIAVVNMSSGAAHDVDSGVECNGVSADSTTHRMYGAGPGQKFVSIDTKTFKKLGSLDLSGPGDGVQVDSARGIAYVANDDGTTLWVIGLKSMKLETSIKIKEAPEYLELDTARNRVYQPIKSASVVQVIDAKSRKVISEWKLGALTGPHGFALDRTTQTAMVVGSNGKLTILKATTGAILSELDVLAKSDQVAYDSKLKRLYIPAQGSIQVVQISGGKGTILGTVPVDKDCKRVSVDPVTGNVWVAFSNAKGSFAQKFKPSK